MTRSALRAQRRKVRARAKDRQMTRGTRSELFEIPAFFGQPNSRLLLLEPAGTDTLELGKRLWEGTYHKPFMLDCGALRFLHFDLEKVQSLMDCDDPDALCLRYTRKMMTFLLFNPRPRHILMLGLGGGSLAKFCYRHLPSATITVVEIDPHVVALRDEFRVPADDERFRIVPGDGIRYMALRGPRMDVILIDAYDAQGPAPGLTAAQFYLNARRRLSLNGVLVMNIDGDVYVRAGLFARIRSAFGQRVIALPVRDDGNLIVLAFRTDAALHNWARRRLLAHSLEKRFGLNFPRYVRKMLRSPTITALQGPR